jgi:hypothetical protein
LSRRFSTAASSVSGSAATGAEGSPTPSASARPVCQRRPTIPSSNPTRSTGGGGAAPCVPPPATGVVRGRHVLLLAQAQQHSPHLLDRLGHGEQRVARELGLVAVPLRLLQQRESWLTMFFRSWATKLNRLLTRSKRRASASALIACSSAM